MDYAPLTHKKALLDRLRPLPPSLVRNLEEWFKIELTYTSNALEGNTLTRRETALVIEKGLTVGGKSLTEHLEATNHSRALDYIESLIQKRSFDFSSSDILSIHALILRGIDDENAGRYRTVSVRISGSSVVMPNARKVPDLMDEFHTWLIQPHTLHPVAFAGEAHYRLVTIHPFVDGNGRTARLLMNLILLSHGYPPAIIRKRDRLAYISALEKAQLGGSRDPYDKIILQATNRSLDIYINAAQGHSPMDEGDEDRNKDNLLKIGELAKAAFETVPTIRYWTSEGLLEVADVTHSGYHLYSKAMIERCEHIKNLKMKRLTLQEIKDQLKAP